MTRLLPAAHYALCTAADLADAARDLAALMAQHEAEDDPAYRAHLAEMIASDAAYLAEMMEHICPALPLVLPAPEGRFAR